MQRKGVKDTVYLFVCMCTVYTYSRCIAFGIDINVHVYNIQGLESISV